MSPVEFDQKKKPTLKGSDSTRTTDSVRLYPQLAIFYWQSNTFTRTVCDDRIKWHWNEPDCIEGWNKFSVRIWSPWEPNLTHSDSCLSQKEKAVFFLCRSSFSEWVQRSPKYLMIPYFSPNGISLRLGEVQMKIYERSLQALLSSALRGFASRSPK